MMEQLGTLLFMASVAAMAVLVWWAMKNDKAGDNGPTHGLLAMRDFTEKGAESAEDGRKRRLGRQRTAPRRRP